MGVEDVLKVLLGKADNVPGFIETHPKLTFGASVLLCYTLLCKALRFQRLRRMQSKYPYKTRGDMARMTNEEAQEIQKELIQCEFPFTMNKALQFALFRTYGIPTISRLLVQTQQLSEKEHAPRVSIAPSIWEKRSLRRPPALRRYRSADPGLYRQLSGIRTRQCRHCAYELLAQPIPQIRQDLERRLAVHAGIVRA